MADQNAKNVSVRWNLVLIGFWGHWLRIQAQHSEIKNGESNMADQMPRVT